MDRGKGERPRTPFCGLPYLATLLVAFQAGAFPQKRCVDVDATLFPSFIVNKGITRGMLRVPQLPFRPKAARQPRLSPLETGPGDLEAVMPTLFQGASYPRVLKFPHLFCNCLSPRNDLICGAKYLYYNNIDLILLYSPQQASCFCFR